MWTKSPYDALPTPEITTKKAWEVLDIQNYSQFPQLKKFWVELEWEWEKIVLSSRGRSFIFLSRFDEWEAAGMKTPHEREHTISSWSQIFIESIEGKMILTIKDPQHNKWEEYKLKIEKGPSQ